MFKQFFSELKLLLWLCSQRYEKTLVQVFQEPLIKKEWFSVVGLSKKYFPFLNSGYFKNYDGLKKQTKQAVKVTVKEIPLPETVLGAYVPSKNSGAILINSLANPVFRLSTLAHELSHAVVCEYYHQLKGHSDPFRVRNRVALFQEALYDKEEIFADALTSIGTYPLEDFKKTFLPNPFFSFKTLLKAIGHLKKHYPDVAHGFLFSRAFFLNMAFIIHFLRLRIFLYKELNI